jgi:chorismate synthase
MPFKWKCLRKPGPAIVTQRKEQMMFNFSRGFFEGKTTGTPIGFINTNQKSDDYSYKNNYRPSHADYV